MYLQCVRRAELVIRTHFSEGFKVRIPGHQCGHEQDVD